MTQYLNINNPMDKYIISALNEDISNYDITTNSIVSENQIASSDLICKEDGILCGIDVFKRVFELLGDVRFETYFSDGDKIKSGDIILKIEGNCRNILLGERTALNYLQRMCGISTLTTKFVDKMVKNKTKLLDTRKTTPNMRLFEKYAVTVGGGKNHRFNLSDGVMIKDNHINAAGGILNAVNLVRNSVDATKKIEVEAESIEMVLEALEAKADIIMLDNMSISDMKKAIDIIGDSALTEISGNVSCDTISKLSSLNADFISCGALTHSAPILDLSLKNLKLK
ncbi:carboxylating nicotinate-nucleotide diphosphorylase [Clostridium chrysemydis]|uniref:carboxylating nicotinate-nucleotide diphosphorylase n=1 Tax=Clostridium chrysemydis TaxID=2665504 RepID=UPI00188479C0|nr:carboxylating nicotinate-nucleotide diphosphorylase [Clostridium chrysemydis]